MQSALLGEAFVTVLLSELDRNLIASVSDDSSYLKHHHPLRSYPVTGCPFRIFVNAS
jgi:hypothetical protein